MVSITHFTDRQRRIALGFFGACWAAVAVANFRIDPNLRWRADIVGLLSGVAAFCLVALAVRPSFTTAYRIGGTCALGSLMFRIASIAFAPVPSADIFWLSITNMAITSILVVLFSVWWLTDVKTWHERRKRDAHDPG